MYSKRSNIRFLEDTVDTIVVSGISYMTGIDYSDFSTMDLVDYVRQSVVNLVK